MKKSIIPIIVLFLILITGIIIWIFNFYIPFIQQGCYEKAGQFGDSFGFFNFIAMIILSITLIIQIIEFRSNREEQDKTNKYSKKFFELQIEFNYNNDIHKNNREELQYYKDLYLKYYIMYIEQLITEPTPSGGIHPIDSELLIQLVQQMFYQPFQKFQYIIKKQFNLDFIPIETRQRKNGEELIAFGNEIFGLIDRKLTEIDKILTDEFEKYLIDIKNRTKL